VHAPGDQDTVKTVKIWPRFAAAAGMASADCGRGLRGDFHSEAPQILPPHARRNANKILIEDPTWASRRTAPRRPHGLQARELAGLGGAAVWGKDQRDERGMGRRWGKAFADGKHLD
jgi:hypothetical protein